MPHSTSPLIHASPGDLSAAVSENLFALFRAMGALPGGEVLESERFSCHAATPGYGMFRGVWRARLEPDEVDSALVQVNAWFAMHGGQDFYWWTDAQTQPADLNQRLLRRGFDGDLVGETGMTADLHILKAYSRPPTGLAIRQALDPAAVARWGAVFAAAFGEPPSAGESWAAATLSCAPASPPWQLYTAFLGGKAVGASLLFKGAGVAGLYAVSTLPEARRMGIGAAVTLRPLLEARAEGYRYAVLFASHMGYPIYKKLGFKDANNPIGIYQGRI